jgi:uncharacterized protein YjbJ (UPF0337 family)
MSALTAKGNWNIAKGKFKQAIARLTEDELEFFEGKVDELVGRIQKRAALSKKKQGQHPVREVQECGCHGCHK